MPGESYKDRVEYCEGRKSRTKVVSRSSSENPLMQSFLIKRAKKDAAD